MKKLFMSLLFLTTTFAVNAEIVNVPSKVLQILQTDDSVFGGCMVELQTNVRDRGLDCENWVTLSCSGELNSKSVASRKLDAAQLVFALDSRAFFFVNDQKKHNGFCFVERIDVLKD